MRVINEWGGCARLSEARLVTRRSGDGGNVVLSWLPFPPLTAILLPVETCIKCKEKSITRVVYCIAYEQLQMPVRTGNLELLLSEGRSKCPW